MSCAMFIRGSTFLSLTVEDSHFIYAVIFTVASKQNHIVSKLKMTATLSLSLSLCLPVVAGVPQDSLGCCITSRVSKLIERGAGREGEGVTFFICKRHNPDKKKKKKRLPAHDFVSKKNSAHLWILVLALINYGLLKIR